jgi:hypothetical protein
MNENLFKLTIQKQRYKPTQIDKYYGVYFLKKLSQFTKKKKHISRTEVDMIYTKQSNRFIKIKLVIP